MVLRFNLECSSSCLRFSKLSCPRMLRPRIPWLHENGGNLSEARLPSLTEREDGFPPSRLRVEALRRVDVGIMTETVQLCHVPAF